MARVGAALALAVVLVVAACSSGGERRPSVAIASTTTSMTTAPGGPALVPAPPPAAGGSGLGGPDGRPYAGVLAFRSAIPVPADLTFVLVIGSDARPGQDVRRANADSLHLLAVNPRTGQGTVLGIPRDAWVELPGRGRGKINESLPRGGPALAVETVRRLTGLPVHYYVLTGFKGLAAMVDDLGGVDVFVDRAMNDAASGARFARGWHHFSGSEALAFTRNRKDVANGDFSRSLNHGTLMLAALAKLRAEVGDDDGLRRWISVLVRHSALDIDADRLGRLGALARGIDPARMVNVVAPGRIGFAGRQSVVYLNEEAARVFIDLRDDAVANNSGSPAPPPPPPTTTRPAPTTTTAPPGPAPAPPAPVTTTSSIPLLPRPLG